MLVVAGTGHRPDKLGGYGPQVFDRLVTCAEHCLQALLGTDRVISGMALGWDQALAQAAINLDIPFHAYTPFTGQEWAWPERSQTQYRRLLMHAEKVVVVCQGTYAAYKMQRRNEEMVKNCSLVLALWNGSEGGTANCVRYALDVAKRPVENCWDYWINAGGD